MTGRFVAGLALALTCFFGAVFGSFARSAFAATPDVPYSTNFSGYLADSSGGLTGSYDMRFSLFVAGVGMWCAEYDGVPVTAGEFSVILGNSSGTAMTAGGSPTSPSCASGGGSQTIDPSFLSSVSSTTDVQLAIQVNDGTSWEDFSEPLTVSSSIFALQANTAQTAATATSASGLQGVSVSSTAPTNGQFLEYNSADSQWEPASGGAGTPGGSNGQVQFNSSGSFGGSGDLTWDNTNFRLGVGAITPSAQLDVSGFGANANGTLRVYDQSASGVTQEIVRAGASQSTTNLMTWENNSGTTQASMSPTGSLTVNSVKLPTGSGSVTVQATSGGSTAVTYNLPNTAGSSGQALTTDGSGNLSWSTISSGGGTVTSVAASSPLSSSGGSTPTISITNGASAGDVLYWTGSAWTSGLVSQDATLNGSGQLTVTGIGGKSISGTATTGQSLEYNGTNWIPYTPSSGTLTGLSADAPLSSTGGTAPTLSLASGTSQGDVLYWDTGTSTWTDGSIATALGSTPLSGSGTAGYLPEYSSASTLQDSPLYDDGGNIGIGTTSASSPLVVNASGSSNGTVVAQFGQSGNGSADTLQIVSYNGGQGDGNIALAGSNGWTVLSGNAAIQASSNSNEGYLSVGTGLYFTVDGGESTINSAGATGNEILFQTAGTTAMTLNANQQVGIGTTAPASPLNVTPAPSPTATAGLVSIGEGGWSGAAGNFSGSSAGTELAINAASGYSGDLANFEINGVSMFKIDASGNVTESGTITQSGTTDETGSVNINTSGSGTTAIGGSSGAVTIGGGGVVDIGTSGSNGVTIGDSSSGTTTIQGTTNETGAVTINGTGSAATSIGTGSTGGVTIGDSSGGTTTLQGTTTLSSATSVSGTTANSVLFTNSSNQVATDNAKLFWNDSSGTFGIGTNSPVSTLYVAGGTVAAIGDANQGVYALGAQSIASASSIYSYGSICTSNSSGDCSGTDGVVLGVNNTSAYVNIPDSGNTFFNNGGNVGIGTTSPAALLDVGSRLQVNASAGISVNGSIEGGTVSGPETLALNFQNPTQDINFQSGKVLFQGSTGDVGIGTTSPAQKLHIYASTGPVLSRIEAGNESAATVETVNSAQAWQAGVGAGGSNATSWQVFNETSNTIPLAITTGGYVGVDNSNPQSNLDVSGTSNALSGGRNALILDYAAASGDRSSLVDFVYNGTSEAWQLGNDYEANGTQDFYLFDAVADAVRLFVGSSGNVGIGTTSPSSPLHVADGGWADQANYSDSASAPTEGEGYGIDMDDGYSTGIFRTRLAMVDRGSNIPLYVQQSGGGATYTNVARFGTHQYSTNTFEVFGNSQTDGNFTATGCVSYSGGTSGTCASDRRLKKDIRPFSLGLDKVLGLQPVFYRYNGLGEHEADQKDRIGFIAQDVEKVAPELVVKQQVTMHPGDKKKTEIRAVNYNAFTYMLVNAVKELYAKVSARFSDQDRRIAALQEQVVALKALVCQDHPKTRACAAP